MCLWDFVSSIKKDQKKNSGTVQEECDSISELDFGQNDASEVIAEDSFHNGDVSDNYKGNLFGPLQDKHPQSSTHVLRIRNKEYYHVPKPVGPSIYR